MAAPSPKGSFFPSYVVTIRAVMAITIGHYRRSFSSSARRFTEVHGESPVNLLIPVYVAETRRRAISEPQASAMRKDATSSTCWDRVDQRKL